MPGNILSMIQEPGPSTGFFLATIFELDEGYPSWYIDTLTVMNEGGKI